jgi:hypothetical protein
MSTPNVGEASLSGEDRVRMERLFEEAVSRIREMYLIMDRIGATSPISTDGGTLTPLPDLGIAVKFGVRSGETGEVSSAFGGDSGETGEIIPVSPRMRGGLCVADVNGCGCCDYDKGVCEPCGPGD